MQVARLRFQLNTRNFSGKLVQMVLALQIERHYSKTQIMEAYLNLAPYGGNIEGIEAASEIYFGKPAAKLTLPEAAALCVIPQNPCAARPAARQGKPRATEPRTAARRGSAPAGRPMNSAPGVNGRGHSSRRILRGRCSRSLGANRHRDHPGPRLPTDARSPHRQLHRAKHNLGVTNAAAMLVDTRGMQVLAQVGSADFATGLDPRPGRLHRQPAFARLYPQAIHLCPRSQQGLIHPLSILRMRRRSFGGYNPENFDREFAGPIRATDALARSRNIPAITLASQLPIPPSTSSCATPASTCRTTSNSTAWRCRWAARK